VPVPETDLYRAKIGGVGQVFHKNAYDGFERIESVCEARMQRYGYKLDSK
jgi:hypothetical protein